MFFRTPQSTSNSAAFTGFISYSFNGKEKDDEWNGTAGAAYDYGFRIYDARICKFLSVDPFASDYPWYSPYQFAGNQPIIAIDIDGLEPEYIITKNGKLTQPVMSLLNAALDYDIPTMNNTIWVKADKKYFNKGFDAQIFCDIVYYQNPYEKGSATEGYTDKKWLNLIAHEGKHREQEGNYFVSMVGFGVAYINESLIQFATGNHWYDDNKYEVEAYNYGLDVNSLIDNVLDSNPDILIKLSDTEMSTEKKSLYMYKYGFEYKLSNMKSELSSSKTALKDAGFGDELIEQMTKGSQEKITQMEDKIKTIDNAIEATK